VAWLPADGGVQMLASPRFLFGCGRYGRTGFLGACNTKPTLSAVLMRFSYETFSNPFMVYADVYGEGWVV
jgi:hypothetical protein